MLLGYASSLVRNANEFYGINLIYAYKYSNNEPNLLGYLYYVGFNTHVNLNHIFEFVFLKS